MKIIIKINLLNEINNSMTLSCSFNNKFYFLFYYIGLVVSKNHLHNNKHAIEEYSKMTIIEYVN